MEENKRVFQSLTSVSTIESAKMEYYKKALDEAYDDDDVLNIAITGTYGAGKSSVWKTYKRNRIYGEKDKTIFGKWTYSILNKFKDNNQIWKESDIIEVSLASFTNEDIFLDHENEEKNKKYIYEKNKIEKSILNQILYEVEGKHIPESKYRIKKKKKISFFGIHLFLLLIFIVLFPLKNFGEIIKVLDQKKLATLMNINTVLLKLIAIFVTLVVPILYIFWKVSKEGYYKNFYIRKLGVKGFDIEVDSSSGTLFDKDLDEVVYIIRSSKAHTIVFEDLDRFEDSDLFVKLRELNILVNKKNEKKVKFVYMLRDDIFISKERTKFFDFIIPVVPILGGYNSESIFKDFFERHKKDDFIPKDEVIERVSIYVDDYRLLKNIYNEYVLYKKNISAKKRGLSPDKLLGIIVYKNVFPSDFEDLQAGKGYVWELFNKYELFAKEGIKSRNIAIKELREEIKDLEMKALKNVDEVMALFIPQKYYKESLPVKRNDRLDLVDYIKENPGGELNYYINYQGGVKVEDVTKEIEKNIEYRERKREIERSKSEQIKDKKSEIKRLNEEIENIKTSNISYILNIEYVDKVNEFFEIERKEGKCEIQSSLHIGLIRYLIMEDLLDKTYEDYLGYFYAGMITEKDRSFLRGILENSEPKEKYEIVHKEMVINKISENLFSRIGVLNYDLFKELIYNEGIKNRDDKFASMISTISRTNRWHFIGDFFTDKIIDTKNKIAIDLMEKYMDLVIKRCQNEMFKLILHESIGEIYKNNLVVLLFKSGESEMSKQAEMLSGLTEHLRRVENKILEVEFINNWTEIFDNMLQIGLFFKKLILVDISLSVWEELEKSRAYELSYANSLILIDALHTEEKWSENYIKSKNLSILRTSNKMTNFYNRIKNNEEQYIEDYILSTYDEEENIEVKNDEEDTIKIYNSDIDIDTKDKFIELNKTPVSELSNITDNDIKVKILEKGLVAPSFNNAMEYFNSNSRIVNDALISFINDIDISGFEEEVKNSQSDNVDRLAYYAVQYNDLELEKQKVLAKELKQKIDEVKSLSSEHIETLVKNDLLELNKYNMEVLMDHVTHASEYVEEHYDDFKDFLDEEDHVEVLSEDVLISLINRNILTDENIEELLVIFNQPISIFGISNERKNIKSYVIKEYFVKDDFEKILSSYRTFEFKEDLDFGINENMEIDELLERKDIPLELFEHILQNEIFKKEDKAKIIAYGIKNLGKEEIENWLTVFKLSEGLEKLFINGITKKDDIPYEEDIIIEALKEKDYIVIGYLGTIRSRNHISLNK